MKMEIRSNQTTLTSDGEALLVKGYVNKTNELSQVLGNAKKFREKIAPGAFADAIENRSGEIDFLAEHDPKLTLASTKNNSLTLKEDAQGLYMEARISPTTYGQDYYQLIQDGLIGNMSFGFRSIKDSWQLVKGVAIRTIEKLQLMEVSAVRNPAYLSSSIAARNIDLIEDVDVPSMEQLSNEKSEYSDNKTEERGNEMEKMIKMTNETEVRGMEEFAQILRGQVEARALNVTTNGATLIPDNVANEIVLKMIETSPVFAKARKLTTTAGNLKINRENDSVVAGFVGEGQDILEQAINFVSVELKQKRVGAAISLSQQLINDSGIDISAYVKDLLARRTAKAVEKSMLIGVGGTEFNGITLDADVPVVPVTGAVTIDELQDLYLKLHPDFLNGAVFILQRAFFNTVAKMKDGMGHYYVQNGVINGKLTYTLFGAEVTVTDALSAGTPALFGNIEEAVSVMIKKDMGIQEIVDGTQAMRGSKLYVFDAYMDSIVTNPQAIVKMTIA